MRWRGRGRKRFRGAEFRRPTSKYARAAGRGRLHGGGISARQPTTCLCGARRQCLPGAVAAFDVENPHRHDGGRKAFAELAQSQLEARAPRALQSGNHGFGRPAMHPGAARCGDARWRTLLPGPRNGRPNARQTRRTKVSDRWFHICTSSCGGKTLLAGARGATIWQGLYESRS